MFLTNFVKTTENLLYVGDYDFPHHDVLLLLSVFDHFLQSPHLKTNNDQHLISSPLTRYGEARVDTFFFFLCKHLVTIFFFRIKKKIKKKNMLPSVFPCLVFMLLVVIFILEDNLSIGKEQDRIRKEKKNNLFIGRGRVSIFGGEQTRWLGKKKNRFPFFLSNFNLPTHRKIPSANDTSLNLLTKFLN